MPLNSVSIPGIVTGMELLPPNGSRIALYVSTVTGSDSYILIGESLETGILIPLVAGPSLPLLYNIHGTAMQGRVSVFIAASTFFVAVAEITRNVDGTT